MNTIETLPIYTRTNDRRILDWMQKQRRIHELASGHVLRSPAPEGKGRVLRSLYTPKEGAGRIRFGLFLFLLGICIYAFGRTIGVL